MKRLWPSLLLLCLASPAVFAATPPVGGPSPAPNGSRFLFVVETSSAMRRMEEANRQALFDMIFTGLGGQMRTGDTFGLWTFSEEASIGQFAMQVFDAQNPMDAASRAAMFVASQKYAGEARLENLVPKLRAVVRAVGDVNIFILSSGREKIAGTTFDDAINAEYERLGKERARMKRPFVTTFVASGGKYLGAHVTIAGQPLPLPDRPAPVKLAATKPPGPAPRTNFVANITMTRETPVLPPLAPPAPARPSPVAAIPVDAQGAIAPSSDRPPQIAQASEVPEVTMPAVPAVPRPRVMQIITKASPPAAKPEPVPGDAAAASAANSAIPAAVETNPLPAVAQSEPLPESTAPVPSVPQPVAGTVAAMLPAATPVAAREPVLPEASEKPPAFSATAVPAPTGVSAGVLLALGGSLLALSVFLIVVVLRNFRPAAQPSLITRSMERRRSPVPDPGIDRPNAPGGSAG